ncbi:MAG: PD-(D/E)XK motif protein [Hyphomonadaceae bacterium]
MTHLTAPEMEALWQTLEREQPSSGLYRARRARSGGRTACFLGVRNSSSAIAALFEFPRSDLPGDNFQFDTEALTIVRGEADRNGSVLFGVELRSARLRTLFASLVSDLIGHLDADRGRSQSTALLERLHTWQEAFKSERPPLTREEAVGLWGELHSLELIAAMLGGEAAVQSWKGPEDGIHDFVRLGTALEIKTTTGLAPYIPISSLDQLDRKGLARLGLMRIQTREVEPERADGYSLAEAVRRVREVIGGAELERKLAMVGWRDESAGRYDEPRLMIVDLSVLEVLDGFPALTRGNVPTGISEVRYQLDPRSLGSFVLSSDAARSMMVSMGGDVGS